VIAPNDDHSLPFDDSLPANLEKAYLELRGADHNTTNSPNTTAAPVRHLAAQALRRRRPPL
jgi:cutinase